MKIRNSVGFSVLSFVLAVGSPLMARAQVLSAARAPFPNFESSAVHPLALSPDGARLVVLNAPDARAEIYTVLADGTLAHTGSVFTGLEPVSVCFDPSNPTRAFVANWLSDDVSVIDVATRSIEALIPVGDEPQDVLVAAGKLFVACARSAVAPQLVAPGAFVENAIVIASAAPPFSIQARVAIDGHRPRALALAGVGAAQRVFVVPQNSSNNTTTLDIAGAKSVGLADPTVVDAFDAPFQVNPSLKAPGFASFATLPFFPFPLKGWVMPQTSRIVNDFEFPALVPQLADKDVFAIDPATNALDAFATSAVGTTLFSIERNPLTGALWIADTDAHNRTRFESHVKGAAVDNRITIVAPGGGVVQQIELAPPLTSVEHAQPTAIAFYAGSRGGAGSGAGGGAPGTGAGTALSGGAASQGAGVAKPLAQRTSAPTAYVAATGSASVVALDAQDAALVAELAVGDVPIGLAVDQARGHLYVLSRGDHALRAFDILNGHTPIQLGSATAALALGYDPEPAGLRAGRVHLYDARASTGHGTGNFSCATCHVSGHMDQLAWDLGDPEGGIGYFYPDLLTGTLSQAGSVAAGQNVAQVHPMKGPMTTQSLRGLADAAGAPLHWRGDRRFFQMFQGAFVGLLGGNGISSASMQEYANFVRALTFPPNPYEPRDRVYTGAAAAGKTLYGLTSGTPGKDYNPLQTGLKCISCHIANFQAGTDFTGSQRTVNFDGETQFFNTPTLRGVYEKEFRALTGFGAAHDGISDGIRGFLELKDSFFGFNAFAGLTATEKDNMTAFVRAWDTGLSPLVGAQIRATATNQAQFDPWLDLAETQAQLATPWIALVGRQRDVSTGAVSGLSFELDTGTATWRYLRDDGTWVSRAQLAALVLGSQAEIVYTAAPPLTGHRFGVDRDEDGLLDGQELALGTDPAAPDSDADGYADGLEAQSSSDPLVPTLHLAADTSAPQIELAQARDVFATTATLHVRASEPASVVVELGLSAGTYSLASVAVNGLRCVHDVVLSALPAKTTVFYRVTASDKNANAAQVTGSFATTPRMLHVDDITLTKTPAGAQWQVTATVTVVDQDGALVPNCQVRGVWAGDIGGQQFFPSATTNASGIATFALNPYTPTAATTVSFSPGYIGSSTNGNPFYVGSGGATPNAFYQQPANKLNYRKLAVP